MKKFACFVWSGGQMIRWSDDQVIIMSKWSGERPRDQVIEWQRWHVFGVRFLCDQEFCFFFLSRLFSCEKQGTWNILYRVGSEDHEGPREVSSPLVYTLCAGPLKFTACFACRVGSSSRLSATTTTSTAAMYSSRWQ